VRQHTLLTVLTAFGALAAGAAGAAADQAARATVPDRSVVVGCKRAVYGQLGRHWRDPKSTLVAGPLALASLLGYVRRAPASTYDSSHGLAPQIKALAVVDAGRAVRLSVPARERDRLSLDYTYVHSVAGTDKYRVSAGASNVTFKPCAASRYPGGRTQFAGGFIVKGAQCAEIDVQPLGSPTATRRHVPFGHSCRR
jgi:hypothetical protein